MKRLIFVLVGCLCARSTAVAAGTGAAGTIPTPLYAAIRSELRASGVPVLLPWRLPRAVGAVRSVALISAGRSGYYVGFSPVANCSGALSCAFFHVAGYPRSTAADRSLRRDHSVRLPDGTRGAFTPTDCAGPSCTEASLRFVRGSTVYELDAKVGRDSRAALEQAYGALRTVH